MQSQSNTSQKGSSRLGSLQEHEKIVNATLLLLGQQPFCRVWRNDTGRGIKLSAFQFGKKNAKNLDQLIEILTRGFFSYGLKGSADIMGILKGGRLLCVEIKSGKARQSTVQKNFQKMVHSFGGVYILARSPEEALNLVKHCLD